MRSVLIAIGLLAVAATSVQAHFLPSSADLPGVLEHRFADRIMSPATTTFDAAVPAPIVQNAPGKMEQVGHEPLRNRGMNAALAVHNGYAYVGYRADGTHTNSSVMVVDVRDPAKPKIAGEIGMPNEANVGESSRELRILPDKNLLLVLNHGCSELIHRCASASTAAGRSPATSNIRFYDISGANAASPKLVSTYLPSRNQPQTPHEFFIWTDPQKPSRVLLYETTPSSESSDREQLVVVDISEARQGKFPEIYKWTPKIGDPNPDNDVRLHSITVTYDGKRMYLAYLGGGFLVADTSDFAAGTKDKPEIRFATPPANRVHWGNPGAHSAIKVPGKNYAFITDEVYGKFGGVLDDHGCPWGWVRMIDTASEVTPRLAAEYKLPVNDEKTCATTSPDRENFSSFASHNPTLTPNLALLTWHSAGFQVVDISDPARPKPAAEFLPQPLPTVETEDPALSQGPDKIVMWSFPVVVDGLIYAVDLRNGLYILRYKGPHEEEVSSTEFLDGNSNHGDLRRFEYNLPAGTPGATGKLGSAGRTPDGRVIPPALPRRSCLAAPLRAGAKGIGPVGLGIRRDRVLLRTGPAEAATPTSARFCVEGGGRLLAIFTAAGRTRLVATSSRATTSRIRRRGARRIAPGLYRRGKQQFFTVSRGRVTTVGVADRSLLRRPATIRRAVRGL